MPHGYECDRCGKFVDQEAPVEMHPELDGSTEEVRIANPNLQSDDGVGIERYTLCGGCRDTVIGVIENA